MFRAECGTGHRLHGVNCLNLLQEICAKWIDAGRENAFRILALLIADVSYRRFATVRRVCGNDSDRREPDTA